MTSFPTFSDRSMAMSYDDAMSGTGTGTTSSATSSPKLSAIPYSMTTSAPTELDDIDEGDAHVDDPYADIHGRSNAPRGAAPPSSASASSSTSSSASSSSSSTVALSKGKQQIEGLEGHDLPDSELLMDRVIKDLVPPPMYALTPEQLFDAHGVPNLLLLKDHLRREGRLTLDCAIQIVRGAMAIFRQEPTLLELKYPITVCGDLHGQFYDLLRLFEVGGDPRDSQYLFLGDYVDRGCFSCEIILLLFAHKIALPKSFHMLRGNHECRQLTSFFNFKDECLSKYNMSFYDEVMNAFDCLPLTALINKSFFCVHGGLSPDLSTLDEIRALDRFQQIPREGPMCDLLWSDPYEEDSSSMPNPDANGDMDGFSLGMGRRAHESTQWFGYNDTRQCSYVYGIEAVKQFLKTNRLTSVIRAHEAQLDGYKMQMINKASGIPRVITIFSAPNYCDVYKNKAACLKFENSVLNIKQFVDSPHPYYLPNFMNVFQWSLPFVAEKVTDMLSSVIDIEGSVEDDEEDMRSPSIVQTRGGLLRKKVTAVSKLLRMFRVLRTEREAIVQLKKLHPSRKVPMGLLTEGQDAIRRTIRSFDSAKRADSENEKYPTPPGSPVLAASTLTTRNFKPPKFGKIMSIETSNLPKGIIGGGGGGVGDSLGSGSANSLLEELMSPPVFNPTNATVVVSPSSPVPRIIGKGASTY